jgi:hypothetical protein
LSQYSCVHHNTTDAYGHKHIIASHQYKVSLGQFKVNLGQKDSQVVQGKLMGDRNWACFDCHKLSDRKHSNANHVAIDFFFNHHTFVDRGCSIDSGLMSTIDLATKFGLFNNKM